MRFHFGAVPLDPEFDPQQQGWRSIREPGPWVMQLLALPVSVLLLVVSAGLLYLVLPHELLFTQPLTIQMPLWMLALILIFVIPVHEVIHALVHPGWGLSSRTVIGLWLSKVLFYAHYEGPMSRNRFLLVFAAPYLVLSILPLALILLLRAAGAPVETLWGLAFLSVIAGVLASGDAIGFWLIFSQIPARATVRNKGWSTYWKPMAEM